MNHHGSKKSREGKRSAKWNRRLTIENLESRLPMHAADMLSDAPLNLTISFVPDGTDVAGHPSDLFEEMGEIASTKRWQRIVVKAFERWLTLIDAKVSIVPDDGTELGAEGESRNDPRFGDIRVAALPMMDDVFAIAIPRSEGHAGTWAGDILFNSDATLRRGAELFAVALHEAGHVLGLGHSDDPNSPMYEHGISTSNLPTDDDIKALKQIYDQPSPNEDASNNGLDNDAANGYGPLADHRHQEHAKDDQGHHKKDQDVGVISAQAAEGVHNIKMSFVDRVGEHTAFKFNESELNLLIIESLNSQKDLTEHTFEVSQPELIQFTLATDSAEDQEDAIISATIRSADGEFIDRLEARSGETVLTGPVFLLPGEYSVVLEGAPGEGAVLEETAILFSGQTLSSTLGPGISDPTYDPVVPDPTVYYPYPTFVITDPVIMPSIWYRDWYRMLGL